MKVAYSYFKQIFWGKIHTYTTAEN